MDAREGGTEDVLSFLAKSELFGALDAEEQGLLADRFEPVTIQGGEILMHEGDPADGIYLVHSGRLQARLGPDDQPTVIGEVGRGEVVGETALLTDRPRGATVVALRDSLLLRLTVEAFEELLARSPMLLRPIAGQVIERLRMVTAGEDSARPVATITAVTLHEGSRCRRFQEALATELAVGEPSLAVVAAVDVPEVPSVTAWLNALEHEHDLVLYLADTDDDDWTRRCLRQADLVILVADGDREPVPTPVEEVLAEHRRRVPLPVELVLVHPSHIEVPTGTHRWMTNRDLRRHHHVREGATGDVARVGRLLTNRGVGLVLSGGGARAMAEIGVIRAMGELGIPIDAVGGTSAGSLVAGAFARGWPIEAVAKVIRNGLVSESNPLDLTLPVSSIAAGRRISERLQAAAGNVDIEDLWIDYFCVSTNLSRMEPLVHRQGRAWRAIRASTSIPGVFPPVAQGQDVLVDGGLVDNLPVGEMRRGHDGITAVAVDVGVRRGLQAGDLPDSTVIGGWRILVDRIHPRRASPQIVGIISLLARLTELGGGGADRADWGDVLVRPDVEQFPILDFDRFDELVEVGYRAGLATLGPWWDEVRDQR
ncbi:MAG: cyclic nucleotide-binding and patatin-like phospholipase domain-containing protein [Acidimicrobiales bacterium]